MAEDNAVNQKVAMLLLKRLGLSAAVVTNGRLALEAVQQGDYNVIIMDVQMPEMDGLEATRRIRAELPPERQPFIVAMTAGISVNDRHCCFEAGMDEFVGKPVRINDLEAAMARARAFVGGDGGGD